MSDGTGSTVPFRGKSGDTARVVRIKQGRKLRRARMEFCMSAIFSSWQIKRCGEPFPSSSAACSTVASFSGQLHSMSAAFLGQHPTALSCWGLHCNFPGAFPREPKPSTHCLAQYAVIPSTFYIVHAHETSVVWIILPGSAARLKCK